MKKVYYSVTRYGKKNVDSIHYPLTRLFNILGYIRYRAAEILTAIYWLKIVPAELFFKISVAIRCNNSVLIYTKVAFFAH